MTRHYPYPGLHDAFMARQQPIVRRIRMTLPNPSSGAAWDEVYKVLKIAFEDKLYNAQTGMIGPVREFWPKSMEVRLSADTHFYEIDTEVLSKDGLTVYEFTIAIIRTTDVTSDELPDPGGIEALIYSAVCDQEAIDHEVKIGMLRPNGQT